MATAEASELKTVTESDNRGKETTEISREDIKDVEGLRTYYDKASQEEKRKLVKEFDSYVKPDLSQAPWLQTSPEKEESAEIGADDLVNLDTVREFTDALKNYPNTSRDNRVAINNMIYRPMRDSESQIQKDVLAQNKQKDKSDERNV